MLSDTVSTRPVATATTSPDAAAGSYIDWAAILAGSVFALAISFLLISFGASLGLSLTSPYDGEGMSAAWFAIAAGIWFAWVMVSAFGAGGYIAGRMRRRAGDATAPEVEVRDGVHGLMVWATGALISTVLATMGVGGLISAGASTVGGVADVATEAASEAASSDYFANLMLRDAPGQTAAADAAPAGSAPSTPPAPGTAEGTGIDPALQQQIASIITRSAMAGEMAERDITYLAQVVAANSSLDEEAARARVDEVNTEIAEARATALAAVEKARVAGVIFGFIAAATLLVGAVAAFFAATSGGRHRDDGLGFDIFPTRR